MLSGYVLVLARRAISQDFAKRRYIFAAFRATSRATSFVNRPERTFAVVQGSPYDIRKKRISCPHLVNRNSASTRGG